MPERGFIGGLDYRFENFPSSQTAQAPQQQAGQYAVPAPQVPQANNDPLAVREKLTSDYYSNMGLLQAYANDMAQKGINVFEPDWSQDGGGLAFQTAEKLKAVVLYAKNALEGEFKAETQTRPYEMSGQAVLNPNVDRSGLYYSDPRNFTSTQPLPGTEELNRRLGQGTNDLASQQRVNARIPSYETDLDDMVKAGLITPEKAELEKRSIVPNTYSNPVFAPRATTGLTQEKLLGRVELVKQIKLGIINGDPSPLNILKTSQGVEDAEYVNTGDKVGINLYLKGQAQPLFMDLRTGGEGEINATLNKINGQDKVPNEALLPFNFKVDLPKTNAKVILDDVKTKTKALDVETVASLNELAAARSLITTDGGVVTNVEVNTHWYKPNELKITYHPVENGKVVYSKTRTANLTPEEVESFINANANRIAPAMGAGFATPDYILDQDTVVNKGGKKIW